MCGNNFQASMVSPTLSPQRMPSWQRLALISFWGGMGFALGLCLVLAAIVWFNGRPRPPKPWNTTAIVAQQYPGVSLGGGEKKGIELTYTLENTTDTDYRIEYDSRPAILSRTKWGTLSELIPDNAASINKPIFIPARQKAFLTLTLRIPGIPERKTFDSDEQYRETLSGFLQERLRNVASFSVFDVSSGYQIKLPRWC